MIVSMLGSAMSAHQQQGMARLQMENARLQANMQAWQAQHAVQFSRNPTPLMTFRDAPKENCRNCGAPRTSCECSYCGTP